MHIQRILMNITQAISLSLDKVHKFKQNKPFSQILEIG